MKELVRSLGLPSVVAISVGAMLGGEIFVLPAVAAGMTGASLWMAYLLAALLVIPAALTKAELSTAIPTSGGSYVFVERAMGPMAGTIAGMGLWLSLLLKSAFALAVLGSYLSLLVVVPPVVVALAVLTGVVALNVVGIRKVGKVQTVVVAACIVVLAVLIVAGGPQIESLHATVGRGADEPWLAGGMSGLLAAVGLVFISYAGVTKIAAIAEEVRDEARNIPLGILISLLIIAAVYTLVAWVLAGIFPASAIVNDRTPIATLAGEVLGPVGVPIVAVTAVAALISMANAGLLAASRFPFAMARDHLAPDLFKRVHQRYFTPVPAIVFTGATMGFIVATFDAIKIAKLASAFMIAAFMVVQGALILFRESKTQWYRPRFRAPLYPLTQIVGIGTGLAILVAMGSVAFVGLVVISAMGLVLYLLYGRKRSSRLGLLRQLARRRDLVRDPTQTGAFGHVGHGTTIVALFGGEPSAEALVQVAMTLVGDGGRIDVVYLREVPEQTDLETGLEPDDRTASLQRRVLAIAAERKIRADFDVVVSRDVRRTLYERASQVESQWVVMAWRDPHRRGRIIRDPMVWLVDHLPCNVAVFRDAGIRTYRHIMTVAEPGPHDALVAHTSDDLAQLFGADVTFVAQTRAHAGRVAAATAYGTEIQTLCVSDSAVEVHEASDDMQQLVQASSRFDLLVMGAPPERPLHSMFFATREDKITERAHCAVLRLKTPKASVHGSLQRTAPPSSSTERNLSHYVSPDAIVALTVARKRERVFADLGTLMSRACPGLSAAEVDRQLRERELQQSTAMGHGLAIPHATIAGLQRTSVGVMTLSTPLLWDSTADQTVDVVFCLVGPPSDRNQHLRLLASIAKLVAQSDLLQRARAATTAPELFATLSAAALDDV